MKLFGFDFTKIFSFIHDLNVIVTTIESVHTSSVAGSELITEEVAAEEEGVKNGVCSK